MPAPLIDIRPDHLKIVCDILQTHVPKSEVWAFGSRAKWTAKEYSDLDLCIVSDQPLGFSVLGALADDFSESDLPYKVDIVDWATTSESFRKIIERGKVVVQKGGKSAVPPAPTFEHRGGDWASMSLGDVITLKRGHDLPSQSRIKGTVPIVSSSGVSGFHAVAKVKGPAVITGRYGTIGQVFYSEEDCWPLNTTLYVEDFKGNDPKFVYYLLKTIDYQKYNDKAAVPGINRNHLHAAVVSVPDLATQREIANTLSLFDDRIALLRESNQTLEAIAQALFKSWFVDFDPVRAKVEGHEPDGVPPEVAELFPSEFEDSELGEVPKRWNTKPVYDLAEYINGAAYKAFSPNGEKRGPPIIKIAELKAGVTPQTAYSDVSMPEKYLLETGDILLSWSGNPDTSIGTFIWHHGRAWLNQHIFRVVIHKSTERPFVLQTLKHLRPVFAETARNKQTTGLGHFTVADMKRLLVVKPNEPVLLAFGNMVAPIHARIFENEQQAITLTALRDSLLPKLMAGNITVGGDMVA